MSEEYREDTQGEDVSDKGSSNDCIADLETDDFIWADVQEEMGRFENFSLSIRFTPEE